MPIIFTKYEVNIFQKSALITFQNSDQDGWLVTVVRHDVG